MDNSGDHISREAFKQEVIRLSTHYLNEWDTLGVLAAADRIPAADVRPVVRGKWENNHCSACGMMPMGEEIWECCDFAPPKFEWFMNFCPNCGAWMEES